MRTAVAAAVVASLGFLMMAAYFLTTVGTHHN